MMLEKNILPTIPKILYATIFKEKMLTRIVAKKVNYYNKNEHVSQ